MLIIVHQTRADLLLQCGPHAPAGGVLDGADVDVQVGAEIFLALDHDVERRRPADVHQFRGG